MTTPPQPLTRLTAVLEHVIRGIAWATQAGAAITYLVITINPATWQPMFDKDPVSIVILWSAALSMAFIWGAGLWEESRHFYDRRRQRLHRKTGLVGHLSVALLAALAAAGQKDKIGLWAVIGMLAFAATATWTSWMQTRLLPDEDQAVIDEIIAREAAQRAAAHDAITREQRRERLTAIASTLGYTLRHTPATPDKPADPPTVRWTIPAGKHAPLVYFIRNGNRMKIGTTTDLKRRIRTLALRQENVTLLVNGDQRREREYHKQFAALRVGHTEWFAYEGPLADYVHDQITQASKKGQPT